MDVKNSVINSKSVKSFYSKKQERTKLLQKSNISSIDSGPKDCYVKLQHVNITKEKEKQLKTHAGKRKYGNLVNEKSKYQVCSNQETNIFLIDKGVVKESSQCSNESVSSGDCSLNKASICTENRVDTCEKNTKNIYYHDNTFWTTSLYKTNKSNRTKEKVDKIDTLNSSKESTNLLFDDDYKSILDKVELSKNVSFFDDLTMNQIKKLKEDNLQYDDNEELLLNDNSPTDIKNVLLLSNIQNKKHVLGKDKLLSVSPKHETKSSKSLLTPKKRDAKNKKGVRSPSTPKQLSNSLSRENKENTIKTALHTPPSKNDVTAKCNPMISIVKLSSSTPIDNSDDQKVPTSALPITPQRATVSCSPERSSDRELSEDPLCDKDKLDSSFDLSFSSTINTSIEEGDDIDQVKCKKKLKKQSIMDYFKVVESKKIKSVDRLKDAELIIIEKKKDRPSKSDLHALFTLPISPRLQQQSTKPQKKNIVRKMKKKSKASKFEQTYIDIGQKNFGHVKCPVCGMIYTKNQEDDEAQHLKFHQKVIEKLEIKRGWKKERIVQEFSDGRIIMISSEDHPSHLKKLAEVREIVDTELGFVTAQQLIHNSEQQAFLFLIARKIVGCAIAVSIEKAYPVIPNAEVQPTGDSPASWCCSTEPVSALCGISRVWVLSNNRRQKIATRLVDCLRYNFLYGCVIPKSKVAFSDPTPNGRSFAERYVGTREILVFR